MAKVQSWMAAYPRCALAALFAVTACASAAALALVGPDALLKSASPERRINRDADMPAVLGATLADEPNLAGQNSASNDVHVSRIAFVPEGALPLRLETLDESNPGAAAEVWTEARVEDANSDIGSENPDTWGTETRILPRASSIAPRAGALSPLTEPAPASASPAATPSSSLQLRLAQIGPAAGERLAAKFAAAHAPWPPAGVGLVMLKDQRALDLYARPKGGAWIFVHRYKVLAASGRAGPKLHKGDRQVPEGVYRISSLNPNSLYHVSMHVAYPNRFDRQMAAKDGRKELGGDIMIHGKAASAGCLAMGDEAAEELFVLAAQAGLDNVKLIIAPTDLRSGKLPSADAGQPDWLPKLYMQIAADLSEFPAPPAQPSSGFGTSLLSSLFGK